MAQNRQISGATRSGLYAVAITTNSTTAWDRCRGVYIGTSQSLDFTFDGTTWITFAGCVAGTVIPIEVIGARLTAAGANPGATDVVFIY